MENQSYKTNLLNDLLFRKLFGSVAMTDVVKHFLEEVCGIKAKGVTIKPSDVYDVNNLPDVRVENDIILTQVDLFVELDTESLATIEMQNRYHRNFEMRIGLYTAKGFASQYSAEDVEVNKYESLKTIYGVNILDFVYHEEPHVTDPVILYEVMNRKYDMTYKDKLTGQELMQIFFVELPKITKKHPKILQYWAALFLTGKVPKEAPEHLQRAAEFIAYENQTEGERQMIIDRQKSRDIRAAERDTDRKEGIEIGIEIGFEKGEEKKSQENILNLLEYGLSVEEIAKALKLPLEEVKQIAKEL